MSGNPQEIGYTQTGHNPFLNMASELTEHYLENYSWDGICDRKSADRFKCTTQDVKQTRLAIERQHPKPKSSNASHCRKCGKQIVWLGNHACEPPILEGINASGQVSQYRQPHQCGKRAI